MKSVQVMSLTPDQEQIIRNRWKNDSSFIGFPDAERDTGQDGWFDNLLVQPDWFSKATSATVTVAVARKGAGKSAVRLTSIERRKSDSNTLIVEVSADELASLHADRLTKASERGYGAVSDWMQIYADLYGKRMLRSQVGQQAAALGAAAAALVGIGEWKDYSPIADVHTITDVKTPIAENAAAYEKRLAVFEKLNVCLADVGDDISALE